MTSYTFKNKFGIWITILVIIDGTEPTLFNDFDNTIHYSYFRLKEIESKHNSGQNYQDIINSMHKISEVEI